MSILSSELPQLFAEFKAQKFLLLIIGLVLMQSTIPVYAASKRKPLKRDQPAGYYVEVKIPEIVQEDLIKRVVNLSAKVYPRVDSDLLRLDIEKYLSNKCEIVVYKSSGPYLNIPPGSQKVSCGCSLYSWENVGVGAKEPPAGVNVRELDKPLPLEEAEKIAKVVFERLVPDPEQKDNLNMTTWGEPEHIDFFIFRWSEKMLKQPAGERTVSVTVRKKDGLVKNASVSHRQPREEPNISYDNIVEIASEEIENFRAKYLKLVYRDRFADRRLVWEYSIDKPTEGYVDDLTRWDAMTGELLYSELDQHKRENGKPYMNPDFYSFPTEEEVKAMVEKLIEKRVEELEEK